MNVIQESMQNVHTSSELMMWIVMATIVGGAWLIRFLVKEFTNTNKELVKIVKEDLKANNSKLDEVLREVKRRD